VGIDVVALMVLCAVVWATCQAVISRSRRSQTDAATCAGHDECAPGRHRVELDPVDDETYDEYVIAAARVFSR
jgi:hypothetical protein